MSDQMDPPWSPRDKDQHLIEALIAQTTTNAHLRVAVEHLTGSVTQLTAAVVQLLARFDSGPAE